MSYNISITEATIHIDKRNKLICDILCEPVQAIGSAAASVATSIAGIELVGRELSGWEQLSKICSGTFNNAKTILTLKAATFSLAPIAYHARELYIHQLEDFFTKYLHRGGDGLEPQDIGDRPYLMLKDEFYVLKNILIRLISAGLSDRSVETPSPSVNASDIEGSPELQLAQKMIHRYISDLQYQCQNWNYPNLTEWRRHIQILAAFLNSREYKSVLNEVIVVRNDRALLVTNRRVISCALANLNKMLLSLQQNIVLRIFYQIKKRKYFSDNLLTIAHLVRDQIPNILNQLFLYIFKNFLTRLSRENLLRSLFSTESGYQARLAEIPHLARFPNQLEHEILQKLSNHILENEASSNLIIDSFNCKPEYSDALRLLFKLYRVTKKYQVLIAKLDTSNDLTGWMIFFTGTLDMANLAMRLERLKERIFSAVTLPQHHKIVQRLGVYYAMIGNVQIEALNFSNLKRLVDIDLLRRVAMKIKINFINLARICGELQELDPELPALYNQRPLDPVRALLQISTEV